MRIIFIVVTLTLLEGDLIRRALRYADISLSKAALWMGMDARQLDRELNGQGHLKATALERLPPKFHQWLAVFRAERYGLPREVRRALPLYLALRGRKQMAKASMTDHQKAGVA